MLKNTIHAWFQWHIHNCIFFIWILVLKNIKFCFVLFSRVWVKHSWCTDSCWGLSFVYDMILMFTYPLNLNLKNSQWITHSFMNSINHSNHVRMAYVHVLKEPLPNYLLLLTWHEMGLNNNENFFFQCTKSSFLSLSSSKINSSWSVNTKHWISDLDSI